MSVAGILSSSLFSNALSQLGQKSTSTSNSVTANPKSTADPSSHVFLGDLQKQLSSLSTGATGSNASLSAQMTQLGKDLEAGQLPAAKSDFNNVRAILSHTPSSSSGNSSQLTGAQQTGSTQTDPSTAAWQAYNSLQLNSAASTLGNSLLNNNNGL